MDLEKDESGNQVLERDPSEAQEGSEAAQNEAEETLLPSPPRVKHVLRARGKWVVIKPVGTVEQISVGGIVLPNNSAGVQKGIVVSVDEAIVEDLKPGMLVVFSNFPQDLDQIEELTGDRTLLLIREEEIYAEAQPTEEMIESINAA